MSSIRAPRPPSEKTKGRSSIRQRLHKTDDRLGFSRSAKRRKTICLNIYRRNVWFIATVLQLYKWKKTKMKEIPVCCYVFLGAIHRLLELGYDISREMCFLLIEKSIEGECHKNAVVYSILQPALNSIGVNAIGFLDWLKEKRYMPSAKHLDSVKKLKMKMSRKIRSGNAKRKQRIARDRSSSFAMPPLTECKIEETDYDEDATVMHLNLSDIHGKDKIVNSVNCSMLDGFHIRSSFDKRNSFDKRSSFDSVDYESNDGK